MKYEKKSIKKIIKRRMELPKQTKMNERNKLRMGVRDKFMITEKKHRPVAVDLVSRNFIRTGIKKNNYLPNKPYEPYEIKDYGKYIKPKDVDYDTIIYISSYNRYEKLVNILNQLYSQKSDYSFKVIVMNDGSTDERYLNLENEFSNTIHLKNVENGGVEFYLKTINSIFQEIKKYRTLSVIQIDDDFILCKNFINILMNKFLELKEENNIYMGIRYHIHSYVKDMIYREDYFDITKKYQGFDGGSLYDIQFLQLFNYELIPQEEQYMWHMWFVLNSLVKKLGVLVYTLRESLAFHNGNDDSKIHPESRKIKKLYTYNFIDNKGNNEQ